MSILSRYTRVKRRDGKTFAARVWSGNLTLKQEYHCGDKEGLNEYQDLAKGK